MENKKLTPLKVAIALTIAVVLLVGGYIVYKNMYQSVGAPMVGNDRDAHGCIGSAGYSWCEAKQKCLRAWEEQCENAS